MPHGRALTTQEIRKISRELVGVFEASERRAKGKGKMLEKWRRVFRRKSGAPLSINFVSTRGVEYVATC